MTTGGPPTRSAGPLMAEEKTLVILDFLVLDKHPRAAADSPLVAPTIDVAEDIGFALENHGGIAFIGSLQRQDGVAFDRTEVGLAQVFGGIEDMVGLVDTDGSPFFPRVACSYAFHTGAVGTEVLIVVGLHTESKAVDSHGGA